MAKSGAKGYKCLTNKQKRENREMKKRMQAEGTIPPNKPRLNRKKFADEVLEEFDNTYLDDYRIREALRYMLPSRWDENVKGNYIGGVSAENVTALKILKIAMDIDKFWKEHAGKNEKITVEEFCESVIEPVLKL